ncbi:PREDICTED: tolloid-like protein 1 isoform X2 [Acropora digitifera]|uniref:tolloid-like protein 1 isoform X2 n=1 Tax=Acropora digitifera TaxID=70779 RepID=UPI00077B18BF|nr:PREDICTED: tolloid-like protein 1 isoform X2 [Acropora digitifera]XP_015764583.1 PREDICTED: tolloid-like protein 1 isoform X2 [Acropora digitifera]
MILKGILAFIFTLFVEFEVVSASCPRQKYEEDKGTLRSPGFGSPSSYGHNMFCTYYINLSPGKRITLEFKTLSILGRMPNCTEDSLEIFVGSNFHNGDLSIGKFCSCSDVSLPKILTHHHCMRLVFKSDGSLKGAGFEAVYTSTENNLTKADPSTMCSTSLVRSSEGTVFTPNWPLKYPPDASCLWSLNLLRSKAARFFFSAFDLEFNFICRTGPGRVPTDDISISGNTTAGREVFIKERVCEMPDVPHFHVKDMASVSIKFRANNNKKEGTGAVIGYLSYKDAQGNNMAKRNDDRASNS